MGLMMIKSTAGSGALLLALLFTPCSRAQSAALPGQKAPAQQAKIAQQKQPAQNAQTPAAGSEEPSGSSSRLPDNPAPAQQAPQEPSLGDLGFSQQQLQPNAVLQARLNRRTEMLKIHQRLGLITLAPMAAALITGPMAKVKGRDGQVLKMPSSASLDLHAALGSTTAALYFATGYYAMFAPRIPGEKKRGAIRMHEALAFIHGPGMILTPILGAMAFSQEQNGEKVHGIASAHGTVATITALAYGASIVAVAWPIHLKFWEKR